MEELCPSVLTQVCETDFTMDYPADSVFTKNADNINSVSLIVALSNCLKELHSNGIYWRSHV